MKELDKFQSLIIKINDEWENEENLPEIRDEYIQGYSQEAYLTLLAILDKYSLIGLRNYATSEWEKYRNNLSEYVYSESAEIPFLKVTSNFLYPFLQSLTNVFDRNLNFDGNRNNFPFKKAIELIPHTALKLNYRVENEDSLDKLIEAFLIPIYPDLNSNPSLTLAESHRQPDSAIPKLKKLLEYKFIRSKSDIRKVIDEAQADIRNYAQHPWEYLYFIFGMNKPLITKEKIENSLLKEPTSFKKIQVTVLKF